MYCIKCGKEIKPEGGFCRHCGTPVGKRRENADSAPPFLQEKKRKQGKSRGIFLVFALVLFAGAGGGILYFSSDGYKCGKSLEQAKIHLEEGEYQEALKYCKQAVELDDQYIEAYQKSADIYMAMDAYQDAIEILEDGLETTGNQEGLEKKLEEVYRREAECLIGTWTLDYNLGDLFPEGYGDFLGVDIRVPILLEIREEGILWFSIEKGYFDEAQSALSSAAGLLGTSITKLPLLGNITEKGMHFLTGLLIDNVGASYAYEARKGVLHCRWSDEEAEERYEFVIDGDRLIFLREVTEGEGSYYLRFPMTLQRVK